MRPKTIASATETAMPKSPTDLEPLLTIEQAAKILNVSPKTLQRRIKAGRLAVIKDEGLLRIRPDDLRLYISQRRYG